MKFYVPVNLNLQEILSTQSTLLADNGRGDQFATIKTKHLLKRNLLQLHFIIDSIIRIPIESKEAENDFGYVNLCSEVLQRFLKTSNNTIKMLSVLERLNIIEENPKYSSGKFSKSYRLTDDYRKAAFEELEIEGTINPKPAKAKREKTKQQEIEYQFQIDNLSSLNFNYNAAIQYTERLLKEKKINETTYTAYKYQLESLKRIKVSYENSVNRFFSNVNNLQKDYRQYILDGENQPLTVIDFASSHSYHLFSLFNNALENIRSAKLQSISKGLNTNSSSIYTNNKVPVSPLCFALLKDVALLQTAIENAVTGGLNHSDLVNEVVHLKNLLSGGGLYEHIQTVFEKDSGKAIDRDTAKDIWNKYFLCSMYPNQRISRWVNKLFPSISRVKKELNRSEFARMLQRSESELVIHQIIKRVALEYPEAKLYSVHDAVMIDKRHLERVKAIVLEEGKKYLGITPKVHIKTPDKSIPQEQIDIYYTLEKKEPEMKSIDKEPVQLNCNPCTYGWRVIETKGIDLTVDSGYCKPCNYFNTFDIEHLRLKYRNFTYDVTSSGYKVTKEGFKPRYFDKSEVDIIDFFAKR